MVIDEVKKEFKSRRINWISEDELIETLNEMHEERKESFPDIELLFETYPVSMVVDKALAVYLLKTNKAEMALTLYDKIKSNKILKKIKPWFKHGMLLQELVYQSFSKNIINKHGKLWRSFIYSYVDKKYKKNYNIDENGYRIHTQKFEGEYFVCFGAEETFGLGLDEEKTWPHILSQKLKKPFKNFGDIKISVDTITRYIWQYLQYEKPSAIFIMFPDIRRIEYYHEFDSTLKDSILLNLLPEEKDKIPFGFDVYESLTEKGRSLLNFLQSYILIKLLCENLKIPFYWYTSSKDLLETPFKSFINEANYIDINNTLFDNGKIKDLLIDYSNMEDSSEKIANLFYNLYELR
jgi:hypothetical protein